MGLCHASCELMAGCLMLQSSAKRKISTAGHSRTFSSVLTALFQAVVLELNTALALGKINTIARIRHFFAQITEECGQGLYRVELWG
jgi:hypothetical protein